MLLIRWFYTRHPEGQDRVQFHLGQYRGIPLVVGPRDYTGMADLVDRIFRKASYKPENLIAEITPGTKLMSLAIG